jgi:hypothetical protein
VSSSPFKTSSLFKILRSLQRKTSSSSQSNLPYQSPVPACCQKLLNWYVVGHPRLFESILVFLKKERERGEDEKNNQFDISKRKSSCLPFFGRGGHQNPGRIFAYPTQQRTKKRENQIKIQMAIKQNKDCY